MVLSLEAASGSPGGPRGLMTERFSFPYAFRGSVLTEQDRVMPRRKWRVSDIVEGGVRYPEYY